MKTSWITLIAALTISFVGAQRSLDLSKPIINLGKRSQPTTWQRPPEERRKLSMFPKTNMKFVVTPKPVTKDESAASGLPTKRPLMRKLIIRDSNDKGSWYFPPREPLMKSKRFTVAADPKLSVQQDTMPKLNIRPTFVPKKPKTLSELKKERELNKVVLNKGNLMSVVQKASEKVVNQDGNNNKVNVHVPSNQLLNKNNSAANEDSSDKMYDYESETATDLYDDEVTTTTEATTTERDNEPKVSTTLPLDYNELLDAIIEGRSEDFDETELTNQIGDISFSKYIKNSVKKPTDKNLNSLGTLATDTVNNTRIFTAQTPQPVLDTQDKLLDLKDKTITNNSQKTIANNESDFSKNHILRKLHSDTTESMTLASVLHDSFKTELPIGDASDDFDPISTKNIPLEENTSNTLNSQNYLTEKSTTITVSEISEEKYMSELSNVIFAEEAIEKSHHLSGKYFSGIELKLDQNIHFAHKQSENNDHSAFSDKPVIDKENKDTAEETISIESNLAHEILSVESLTESQSIDLTDDVTTEAIVDMTSYILPNIDQLTIVKSNKLTNEDVSHESIVDDEKNLHESIANPFNGLKDDSSLQPFIDKSSPTLSHDITFIELLTDTLDKETNEKPSNVSNLTGENMSNDSMLAQYSGISDDMSIDPSIDNNRSILAGKLMSDKLTIDKINNLNDKENSFESDKVSVEISNESLMDQSNGSEITSIEPESSGSLAKKQVYNDSILDIINNLIGDEILIGCNKNVDELTNDYNVTDETISFEVEGTKSADLNDGNSSHISSDKTTFNEIMTDIPDKKTGEEFSNESNLTGEDISNNLIPAQSSGISDDMFIDPSLDNTSSSSVHVDVSNEPSMNQPNGSEMTTIEPELSSTLAEKQVYDNSILDITNNLTGEEISSSSSSALHVHTTGVQEIANDSNINVGNVTNFFNVTVEATSFEEEENESADLNDGIQISSDEITSNEVMSDVPDNQTGQELSNESNLTDEDIPNNLIPAQTTGVSDEISIDLPIDNTFSILTGKLMSDELTIDKINNLNGKETSFESDEVSVEISNKSLMNQTNGSEMITTESELGSTLAEKQVYNDSILDIINNLTGEEISNDFNINVDAVTNDYNVTVETASIKLEENESTDLNDGTSSHISLDEITTNEFMADIPDAQTDEELSNESNLTDEDIPNNSIPAQSTGVSDEISIDLPIENSSSILSGELISDELIINKFNDLSAKETSNESDVVGVEILNESLMDQSASGEMTSVEPVSDELSSSAHKQVDNESILHTSKEVFNESIIADERIFNDSNVIGEAKSTQEKNESTDLNDGISIEPISDADSTNLDNEQLSDEQMVESSSNFTGEEISDESNFAREEISNESNQSADISLDGSLINTSASQQVSHETSMEPIPVASELIHEEVYNDSFADSQNFRLEEKIDGALDLKEVVI